MTMLKTLAAAATIALAGLLPVAATAQDTATEAPVEITDFSVGPADAKVQITEYASFTCPHCANFHATVWPQLKADYIDTGKVRFTYREVYFDRYGLWAAMIARCGGEMRYFGIVDMLFEKQQDWAASDDPNVVVGNLRQIGKVAGMDDATMDACMKDGAKAEAMVAQFEANMEADGIEGTPSFIINGEKHSNMSYEDMKAIIDAELAE
ncbi:DsbA family protein [Rhodobacteraceae bacterium HSP-20]|jgi:protein-disulfide isomerase|uniref:DsbA family protein n=1 Tax=Paragemmobacter amnigenus TaxID=2852097 RepID=A0ABS6J5X6_9RHOB|nr:DsbA family protein [Rhodobacter amnigenus]MBV4389012.1 DsbA family protein [Rhodobacter amnigenus]